MATQFLTRNFYTVQGVLVDSNHVLEVRNEHKALRSALSTPQSRRTQAPVYPNTTPSVTRRKGPAQTARTTIKFGRILA
jgi:hypothetical protein